MKKIIIIAGPNGAGKTTFAKAVLPNEANCTAFIHAKPLVDAWSHVDNAVEPREIIEWSEQ